jgi:predicted PurR-regulated permease PerM
MKCSLFVLIAIIGFLFQPVIAQSSDSRIAELERLVTDLQRRVSILEAQLQEPDVNFSSISSGDSTNIQNWRQLRMGMSEQAVESFLGSPSKVDVNEYFFTWYYNYPFGGSVTFDSQSRGVEGWNEP